MFPSITAIDEDCNLSSPLGLQMAEFPLTPMFSKMLLESGKLNYKSPILLLLTDCFK